MSFKKILPKVSIVINNYNYGCFLSQAIDSAINQTYPNTEIIVVDDGSADDSRKIIASYEGKVFPILKKNGGQGSAFNSGFQSCTGDYICFLDADDLFHPNKLEECLKLLIPKATDNSLIMVYHLLEVVDKDGNSQHKFKPCKSQYKDSLYKWQYMDSPCNFYEFACKYRYVPFAAAPTSGLMLSRELAEAIFPIPENGVYSSADSFVVRLALLIGEVHRIEKVLSSYRVHGQNNWETKKIKVHPKEFTSILEDFLNLKLKENNKQPIISFYDSMYPWQYYKHYGTSKDLLKLAYKVVTWHQDYITIRFFFKTILRALKMQIKQYKRII